MESGDLEDIGEDEVITDDDGDVVDGDGEKLYRMHRPSLQDRFGTLRFRTEYSIKRNLLLVTIVDAWDLPPMDNDGRADPYVEVSLRPGHKKYTTNIKNDCLNPTYNETAELPLKIEEIAGKHFILKVHSRGACRLRLQEKCQLAI